MSILYFLLKYQILHFVSIRIYHHNFVTIQIHGKLGETKLTNLHDEKSIQNILETLYIAIFSNV